MELINERIKLIRKALNMKQNEFSKELMISQGHLSDIENGRKDITNKIKEIMILKFNVNEVWLQDGIGEMFIEPDEFSLDDYVKSKGATDFELSLIKGYFDLPAELRTQLMNSLKKSIFKDMENKEISAAKEETFEEKKKKELEAYALELDAEQKGEISSVSEKPKGA